MFLKSKFAVILILMVIFIVSAIIIIYCYNTNITKQNKKHYWFTFGQVYNTHLWLCDLKKYRMTRTNTAVNTSTLHFANSYTFSYHYYKVNAILKFRPPKLKVVVAIALVISSTTALLY